MLYLISQLYTVMRSGGLLEAGVFDESLYPIPFASRSAAGWAYDGPGQERRLLGHHVGTCAPCDLSRRSIGTSTVAAALDCEKDPSEGQECIL